MKYLEYTPLDCINDFLSDVNLGERTIQGCLEAYSCKHTGTDKKLSLSLEHEEKACRNLLDPLKDLGPDEELNGIFPMRDSVVAIETWRNLNRVVSPDTDSSSPVEYLCSRSSRRTLIYLILTLYQMYPDYDFSAVNAHQFFTEESWDSFKQIFDAYMFEASKKGLGPVGGVFDTYDFICDEGWVEANEGSTLLDTLYKALDEVVKLAECEIYSYSPDSDADPFLERGALWSFTFFFYNRKLKRVVSFRFSCLSNLVAEGFLTDGIGYEEDGEIFDDMDI